MTAPRAGTALRAVDVHKTHRRGREEVRALRGVSLEVAPGEVVALLGRSGSGKTTLLNCLLGWEVPDRGTVVVPGAATPGEAAWGTLAVVPQQFGLLPELSLLDNVAVPAELAGVPDPLATARADLASLELEHLADRVPGEVSLGEQQRVALARALVARPAFLVADEPTGRMDEELSARVLALLRDRYAAAGTGMLIASHDPLVLASADRALHLVDGRLLDRQHGGPR